MDSRLVVPGALVCAMALNVPVRAGQSFTLEFAAISGGGGLTDNGSVLIVGQAVVGTATSDRFTIEVGAIAPLVSGQDEGSCVRDPEWVCDGDVDGDGQVNPVDSGLVQAAFGSGDEQDMCNYDVDCDGQINPVDSGIVQSLFGTCEEPRNACP